MGRVSHLRAALIGLALLGHGVYALPLPRKITAEELAKPDHQRDLDLWTGWVTALGLPLERADLARITIEGSTALGTLHDTLKKPWAPLFGLVGVNQAWALFASATTHPDRLVVAIQADGSTEWTPILRRLDPCCGWHEAELEYRRIRGVWDGQNDKMRPGYKGLTKWIARRAFDEHPEAARVRVYLERGESVYPWEPPVDATTVELERVHRRDQVATW
jgi:hypothetical protein